MNIFMYLHTQIDTFTYFYTFIHTCIQGDGGGSLNIGPSEAEFDATKELLEAAQEEVVELTDKCDQLQAKILLLEQRLSVYEQLLAMNKEKARNAPVAAAAAPTSDVVLGEVITHLKNAINKVNHCICAFVFV